MCAKLLVGEQSSKGSGKLHDIVGLNKKTVDLVFNQIGRAPDRGCHHGFAEGHGLEKYQSESLARARQCENIGMRVAGSQLFSRQAIEEVHPIMSTDVDDKLLKPWQIVTTSDNY
ncbi:MAG: hypothetical protein WA197_18630 [Candidatus Acidiferrales bacterium]